MCQTSRSEKNARLGFRLAKNLLCYGNFTHSDYSDRNSNAVSCLHITIETKGLFVRNLLHWTAPLAFANLMKQVWMSTSGPTWTQWSENDSPSFTKHLLPIAAMMQDRLPMPNGPASSSNSNKIKSNLQFTMQINFLSNAYFAVQPWERTLGPLRFQVRLVCAMCRIVEFGNRFKAKKCRKHRRFTQCLNLPVQLPTCHLNSPRGSVEWLLLFCVFCVVLFWSFLPCPWQDSLLIHLILSALACKFGVSIQKKFTCISFLDCTEGMGPSQKRTQERVKCEI